MNTGLRVRVIFVVVFLATLIFLWLPAFAITEKEERALEQEAARIDAIASTPPGQEKVVMDRLVQQFNVSTESIQSMRSQNMGFGEIFIALAIAKETKKDLNTILSMRSSKMGWGKIARELGLKSLGFAVKEMKKAETALSKAPSARGPQKGTKAGETGKGMGKGTGKGEGHGSGKGGGEGPGGGSGGGGGGHGGGSGGGSGGAGGGGGSGGGAGGGGGGGGNR